MRLHVLKIATRFKMNLPKRSAARLKPVFRITQVGGMWGAGLVADLARVFFEPLAEDIAVVDDLNHRGFVPDGCLEEVGQGWVCLPRLLEDMPSATGQVSVSAHYLDIWSEGL
jgi:hypothetical protein